MQHVSETTGVIGYQGAVLLSLWYFNTEMNVMAVFIAFSACFYRNIRILIDIPLFIISIRRRKRVYSEHLVEAYTPKINN